MLGGSFQSNILFQTVAALSTAYGTFYNHQNHDPAAFAADVGGGTGYSGLADGSTVTVFASIRGQKENGTSGNQLGYCAIRTNIGGGNTAEGVRWDSAQNTRIPSGSVTGFSSSATNAAAIDTGFSRVSAGIAALGNGTALNASGTLQLAALQSASALTITATGAILSLDGTTIETSATAITADAGLAISTTATGVLSLDSGTTGAINLGTGANAKTVTIGNTTGASGIILETGSGNITVSNVTNFVFSDLTGTKFGTATSQKIGFYNATPVVQQTNVANPTGGATVDAESRTAIDAILTRLETLGLFAA